MEYLLRVTIEPKEDVTIENAAPQLPASEAAASYLEDNLADLTKHDGLIGWRVLRVRPA